MSLSTEHANYPVNMGTHNGVLSSRPSFTYATQLGTDCPHFEACELALLDICLYGKCLVLLNMTARNSWALSPMLPRIFGATRLPRYWRGFREWLQALCDVLVTTVLLVPAVKMRGKSQEKTRFEILTAVGSLVRCDSVLLGNFRHFEWSHYLVLSFETSLTALQAAERHIQEDLNLYRNCMKFS
jgi:hypothetical protein